MAEHLDAVLVLVHAGGVAGLVDVLDDVGDVSAYVLPGLCHLLEVAHQVALLEKCLLGALFLLLSQVGQVVLPHFVDDRPDFCVEGVEKGLLLLVVPADLLRVDGLALLLNSDDVPQEVHDLVVPGVAGVLGVAGKHSGLPAVDFFGPTGDPVDRESLAGCLSGADSTVEHVLVLNVDVVLGLLVGVVLVGAAPLLHRLPVRLLGPEGHLLLPPSFLQGLSSGRPGGTDHGLAGHADLVGRPEVHSHVHVSMRVGMGAIGGGVGVVVADGVEGLLTGRDHGLVLGDEVVEVVEASRDCHPLAYNQ